MSLLDRFKGKPPADSWHPGEKLYPSLFDIGAHAPALKGKGGVYALWHLGVRPQWLRVAAGPDLLACLSAVADALAASPLRANGGIFAAWTFIAPARWPGVVAHLEVRLAPALQRLAVAGEAHWARAPVPVVFPLPPGTTGPGTTDR